MNKEQQHALSLVLEGHNIIMTGQARTGKTHFFSKLSTNLKVEAKTLALLFQQGKQQHYTQAALVKRLCTDGLKFNSVNFK